jgi:nitrite reductase/ring-hydroxylating ferredoxin subunit
MPSDGAAANACATCTGSRSRRDFLRDATATAVALLVGLGARPSHAAALPVRWAIGIARDRDVRLPVPGEDGVMIDRQNELIVVRWEGEVHVFALSCPHQRTMLRWIAKDGRFQCPKHKSKYEPDGTFVSGRATRGMDRYPVRRDGGDLVISNAKAIRQDEDGDAWHGAVVKLA